MMNIFKNWYAQLNQQTCAFFSCTSTCSWLRTLGSKYSSFSAGIVFTFGCCPILTCLLLVRLICLMKESAFRPCHGYTAGMLYFWTDHFISLSCVIKMSSWSCQMNKCWPSYSQKKSGKEFLLNIAYNTHIFPTNTVGKKLQVKCMQNLVW